MKRFHFAGIAIFSMVIALFAAFQAQAQIYDANAALQKAQLIYDARHYEQAETIYRSVINKAPERPEPYFALAKIHFMAEEYDQAIQYMQQAVTADSSNADYYAWLGRLYGMKFQEAGFLSKMSWGSKSNDFTEKALETDPNNALGLFGKIMFLTYAPGIAGGNKDEAAELIDKLLPLDLELGTNAKGLYLVKLKQFTKAEQVYREALEIEPGNAALYVYLAQCLVEADEPAKAWEAYQQALTIEPDDPAALFGAADLAAEAGQPAEKSIEYLEKLLEAGTDEDGPAIFRVHYRLGEIYEAQGQPEKAREHYIEAIKLREDFKAAKKALKKLD